MKEYIKPELKNVIYTADLLQSELGDYASIGEDEKGNELANEVLFDAEELPRAKSVWE